MVGFNLRFYFILFIFIFSIFHLYAGRELDSLLISRDNKLSDYYQFKDEMKERTWLNMVNLNEKALMVIKADNQIIDRYLNFEMNRTSELNDQLEQIKLENSLLKKEIEINAVILEEKRLLSNKLFIATLILAVSFIIILIFFIDRHIRFRSTRMELERQYAWTNNSQNTRDNVTLQEYKSKIERLTKQNETINKQLKEILQQKKTRDQEFEKELNSRKEMEKEITQLISQIKKISQ
jgi:flagellar biosynthesis GTPase FlhF